MTAGHVIFCPAWLRDFASNFFERKCSKSAMISKVPAVRYLGLKINLQQAAGIALAIAGNI